ncbi:MAG: peptidylprolyl isomerase [Oscillospiraceae bacterium]|nr:peptidylprolyl isomerase [Oscillospiraceae bacterium]
MEIKRIATAALAAAMLLTFAAGCGKKDAPGSEDEPTVDAAAEEAQSVEPESVPEAEEAPEIDRPEMYRAMRGAFSETTLMAVAGGREIYWPEYCYWLISAVEYVLGEAGSIDSWQEKFAETTAEDRIFWETGEVLKLYRAIELKCEEKEVALSDEEEQIIRDYKEDLKKTYGGEDEFLALLEENFMPEDTFDYSNRISSLYYLLFSDTFGVDGADFDDEEVFSFAEQVGYARVKLIYIALRDSDGREYDDEKAQDAKKRAEDIYSRLEAAAPENKEPLFTELMNEHSEDENLKVYPDGYSFLKGSGVFSEEFEAAAEMEIGEISELIKTENGYCIFMRTQIDPDSYVDETYTLRYYAAMDAFETLAEGWTSEISYSETEAAQAFDLEKWLPTPLKY